MKEDEAGPPIRWTIALGGEGAEFGVRQSYILCASNGERFRSSRDRWDISERGGPRKGVRRDELGETLVMKVDIFRVETGYHGWVNGLGCHGGLERLDSF